MKTKYTSKPWSISIDHIRKSKQVVVHYDWLICELDYAEDMSNNDELIIAAPEMFEEFDTVLEDFNSIIDNQKSWGIEKTQDHCLQIQSRISQLLERIKGE